MSPDIASGETHGLGSPAGTPGEAPTRPGWPCCHPELEPGPASGLASGLGNTGAEEQGKWHLQGETRKRYIILTLNKAGR